MLDDRRWQSYYRALYGVAIVNARLYQVCVLDQRMTAEALWSFYPPDDLLEK